MIAHIECKPLGCVSAVRHCHRKSARQQERSHTVRTTSIKVRLSVRGSHSNLPWPDLQYCNITSISVYKSGIPFLYQPRSYLYPCGFMCLCVPVWEPCGIVQFATGTRPSSGTKALTTCRRWQPRVTAKGSSTRAGVTEAVQTRQTASAEEPLSSQWINCTAQGLLRVEGPLIVLEPMSSSLEEV